MKFKRILALVLSVLMLATCMSFTVSADTLTVYVSDTAAADGNGQTAETAFDTFEEAWNAVAESGGIIKLVGTTTFNGVTAACNGDVIITSDSTKQAFVLNNTSSFTGGGTGKLTFQNMTLYNGTKWAVTCMYGLEFEIGTDVDMPNNGTTMCRATFTAGAGNGTKFGENTIVLRSGAAQINVSHNMQQMGGTFGWPDVSVFHIGGSHILNVDYTTDWGTDQYRNAFNNINLLLDTAPSSIATTVKTSKIHGAYQILANNGVTTEPSIATDLNSGEPASGKYFVYSAEGGRFDFITNPANTNGYGTANNDYKTGEFKVTTDKQFVIVDNRAIENDGVNEPQKIEYATLTDEGDGKLITLTAGIYDVTYVNDTANLTFHNNDGTDASQLVTIEQNATDISAMVEAPSREGYRFLGWNTSADGNGTPVDPANFSYTQGVNDFYAVWAELAAYVDGTLENSDTEDGTQANPYNTFEEAWNAIAPTGGKIVVLGDTLVNTTTTKLDNNLVITAMNGDENTGAALIVNGADVKFAGGEGHLTFENIALYNNEAHKYTYMYGLEFELGEGVTLPEETARVDFVAGAYENQTALEYGYGNNTIVMRSGGVNITLGARQAQSGGSYIGHPNVNFKFLGGASSVNVGFCAAWGTNQYYNRFNDVNVLVDAEGATFYSSNLNYVMGQYQYIANNGVTTAPATLAPVAPQQATNADYAEYIIYSGKGGRIDFIETTNAYGLTAEAGNYKMTTGHSYYRVNGGERIAVPADGIITLDPGTYTITYETNPVEVVFGDKTYTIEAADTDISDVVKDPTNEGYTFDGWYTAANGEGTKIDLASFDYAATPGPFYASWKANNVTVTFDLGENGTTEDETTVTVKVGEVPTAPAVTAKAGWTFKGWDKEVVAATEATTYTAQYTQNQYTVKFIAGGKTLAENTYTYGETPSYDGAIPEKTADAQYTYAFAGWSPEIEAVTTDATYEAVYTPTLRSYTITWVIDGKTETETYAYGAMPTHANPVKEGDAQYTYTFTGWDKEIAEVTGDATYTAQFESAVNEYTVTWIIDGETEKQTYKYGETPAHADPVKEGDAQYSYTFTGWDKEIAEVTGDATYTAQFESAVNEYTVTWIIDGETEKQTYKYGEMPTHADAVKEGNAQYGYTFTGWSPAIETVTGDATYTAQFAESINAYTVTWIIDGVSETETYAYGEMPAHADPVKAGDAEHSYTFTGWSPAVVAVTGNATYTAQFSESTNVYTVTWVIDGVSETETYAYGAMPAHADPVKAGDAEHSYTFTGWSPAIVAVTGNATYTAQFSESTNEYTITWVIDGETETETYAYGEMPTHANPVKAGDAEHSYTFTGWSPAIVAVTGNATYTAQFSESTNEYTITWVIDGVEETEIYAYGAMPTHTNPVKADYRFIKWTPAIATVTGDATYTAVFEAIDYVAEVNGTKYETLAEAVAVGGEVILIDNVTLTEKLVVNGNVTLNLGGKTLTLAVNDVSNYDIVVKGNLTIEGEGNVVSGAFGIGVTGSLTVNGGNFTSEVQGSYIIGNWGTTTINGGSFDASYMAVNGFGGTVSITNGDFKSDDDFYVVAGNVQVTGGTFDRDISYPEYDGFTFVADGYLTEEVNGSFIIRKANYIAEANGVKYESLAEAVAVGGEVTLIDNVTLTEKLVVNGDVTLNLGGKTLTSAVGNNDNYDIVVKGNLTIEGEGNVVVSSAYGIGVTGTLTVNGGNFTSETAASYIIGNWGTTTINGGNFDASYMAVNGFGGTVSITGGDFKSDDYFYVVAGNVKATGGTFDRDISYPDYDELNYVADGYTVDEADGAYTVRVANYIAEANGVKYESLAEAIAAADKVTLLGNASGAGVVINKDVEIDLGTYTYTFVAPAVGSEGTKSQCFQILKNNLVVIKNGKLDVAEEAKAEFAMLIQNYADLTLTDVVLDGTNLDRTTYSYVVSNNSGNVVINGNASIIANDSGDAYAFDVYDYSSAGYTIPNVTVNTTGTITGVVEVSGGNLVVEAGTFTSEGDVFVVTSGKLTVNDATVTANTDGTGTANAIWANGGEVEINDGTFSVGGDTTAPANHQNDMIYTKNGGTVVINGGEFLYTEGVWTLNENDANRGTITVKGGTFNGWNPENNVSEGENTSFLALGYNAEENDGVFTVVESVYTVTFVVGENGTTEDTTVFNVKYNETITAPEVVANAGWTFTGWDADVETTVTNSATYTAQYEKNSYKVTFTINGEYYDETTVDYGAYATAPEYEAEEGWTFSGWDVSEAIVAETTIDATLTQNEYTITFVVGANGTTEDATILTLHYGDEVVAPNVTANEGWTFTGWDKEVTAVAGDETYTAQYTQIEYTVTFVDGEEEYEVKGYLGNKLNAPVLTKEHFALSWTPALTETIEGDATYTAVWTPVEYTVTFYNGDATFATASGVNGTALANPGTPENEGFEFLGWATTASGEVIELPTTISGNANYFAIWSEIFTVAFHSNYGAEEVFATVSGIAGDFLTMIDKPERENYNFRGWSTTADGKVTALPFRFTGNADYYAVWTAEEYTATFYRNDNSDDVISESTVKYGSEFKAPTVARTGYTFLGWSTTPDGSIVTDFAATADADFYAIWELAEVIQPGEIIEIDGVYYYQEDGVGKEMGLFYVEGGYYLSVYDGSVVSNKVVGTYKVVECNLPNGRYEFGADGKMLNGIVEKADGLYYYENGVGVEKGLFEYEGDYYFSVYGGKLITDRVYGTYMTSCDLPNGRYEFGADGKMLNGIVNKNGVLYYYENGVGVEKGLFEYEGNFYFSVYGGELVTNRVFGTYGDNEVLGNSRYEFGADGKMLNGIVEKADGLYYYENGVLTEKGLFEYEGEYYFSVYGGQIVTGKTIYAYMTNCDLAVGTYEFGADGKMVR